jgi:L-asparaginase II
MKTLAAVTRSNFVESIHCGFICTDGCGLPIFLLPIEKMAMAYARLANYAFNNQSKYHEACRTIWDAMTRYPCMVAGEGEFCTELMKATKGRIIGKIGAEAVYCLGLKEKNLAFALK